MRSTPSFIALVFLASALCFLPATDAHAEKADNISSSCGATSREAIAAAEKALAEKRPESQARAVACLLAAVKGLEAERQDIIIDNGKQRLLNVPRSP